MSERPRHRDMLTAQEAADLIHVHEQTIRRAIGRGELRAISVPAGRPLNRVGRGMGYRIRRSDLARYLFGDGGD